LYTHHCNKNTRQRIQQIEQFHIFLHQQKSDFALLYNVASVFDNKNAGLQHNNTHTTTLTSINLVFSVNARRQVGGTVVKEVIVQLAISGAEFLVGEEEWVVEEG
jgi:hypothetical protein